MPKLLLDFIYVFLTLLKLLIFRAYHLFQKLYYIIGYLFISTWNPLLLTFPCLIFYLTLKYLIMI